MATHTQIIRASSAITATATSAAFSAKRWKTGDAYLAITAVTGTVPTLDVALQESSDGGTTWYEIARPPNGNQKDCHAPTSRFTPARGGKYLMTQTCRKGSPGGAPGKDYLVDPQLQDVPRHHVDRIHVEGVNTDHAYNAPRQNCIMMAPSTTNHLFITFVSLILSFS